MIKEHENDLGYRVVFRHVMNTGRNIFTVKIDCKIFKALKGRKVYLILSVNGGIESEMLIYKEDFERMFEIIRGEMYNWYVETELFLDEKCDRKYYVLNKYLYLYLYFLYSFYIEDKLEEYAYVCRFENSSD